MTDIGIVVSRHFLRRRARKRQKALSAYDPTHVYRVVPAQRGPFRWRVVKL